MSKAKKNTKGWLIVAAAAVLVIAALLLIPEKEPVQSEAPAETETIQTETQAEALTVLKDAIQIDEIGTYTGLFIEDGSDEAVSDLLMMVVTNISPEPIQYAQIQLDLGGETAEFAVSVLPSGGTAVLIEQNRMKYDKTADYAAAGVECVHLAGFDKPLSMQEDKLQIQVLDGAINISNISGKDITETILLCYKNISNGVYHGGIAYRVRLEDGLKAGEVRQIMGTHFRQDGSEVLFVDFAA